MWFFAHYKFAYAAYFSSAILLEQQSESVQLRFPIPQQQYGQSFGFLHQPGLYLRLPSNIESSMIYDPVSNTYIFRKQVGTFDIKRPEIMSFSEFRNFDMNRALQEYWIHRTRSHDYDSRASFIPDLSLGGEAFDRIFGSDIVNVQPQGSAELIFGINIIRNDRPDMQEELRRVTTFDFQEKIQMNITGTIGDKMRLGINYNTEAMFEFENRTKLEYTGKEDEIIKKIEAGNVSLPLPGTLITGSQSLFGLKTELQFGKLTMTSVFSQQKGQTQVIDVKGGATTNEFEIFVDDYDANRHFFLAQYFKDTYDRTLRNLPVISTGINITRIEVWITNKTSNFENSRNIVAFMDLAEADANIFSAANFSQNPAEQGIYPWNQRNNLYQLMTTTYLGIRNINNVTQVLNPLAPGFIVGQDYEVIENARLLSPREFSYNSRLGFISLNQALNADEILAVAFEYTLGGKTYRVGEFSTGGITAPNSLILKLIKGTNLTPKLPTWGLMMKNIYSLGAWQISPEDFQLNVLYQDDKTGNALNFLPAGNIQDKTLLTVMNLDNLNSQLDPHPDGFFDFIEGVTIEAATGRIIFPVLEPFGSHLRNRIGNDAIADRFVFQELYDSTQTVAKQMAERNKFKLSGVYQSSAGAEIPLNATNIPRGSVIVTAGGIRLNEGTDFTVDYALGRVQIINTGLLESGTPIRISLESQSLFAIQTKTLVGSHFDYRISDNFNIGATILNLTERPLTQKVNFGDEPISNTIWGLNAAFSTESRFLTTLVDNIPFIDTKESSAFTFTGEFAQLIPGHAKAIGPGGVSYIDDFEGTKTLTDLKTQSAWVIASTPHDQSLFPEASLTNNLAYGFNRARIAWYHIDPIFQRNTPATPSHIRNNPEIRSNHFVREVLERELFPLRDPPTGAISPYLLVLNVAYYPAEKGPYNYDVLPTPYSAGISADGSLLNPETRWGGIMRPISFPDFERQNIEYIEFWLMDPFVYDQNHDGGDLFFNLGNVSEDILKDGRKSFENGLPTTDAVVNVDTTAWGRIPTLQSLVNAFDNDPAARRIQDVGMDGIGNEDERNFFQNYLNEIAANHGLNSPAYQLALNDPSNDDYRFFRGSQWDAQGADILTRYKFFNGMDGNSPTPQLSPEPYPTSSSILPNNEDINRDNTLSQSESFYQYRISIRLEDMRVGNNFIVDSIRATVNLANGNQSSVNWYQFKIPLSDFESTIGPIRDFKSIRFMRMFLRNFSDSVILRFATLDLVRSEWRKYDQSLVEGQGGIVSPEPPDFSFHISAVNIEENAGKTPVNYVLPPGIDRVIDPANPQLQELNEQSLVLKVEQLPDGDSRAAFKNTNFDIRQYRRLKLEVHAAALVGRILNDRDLSVFIRLGTDYRNNYYEYEVPLVVTPAGRYDNNSESDRRIVWPDENRIDLELDIFQKVKQLRNEAMRQPGSQVSMTTVYDYSVGNNTVRVVGNPNLSNVRTIMIGVRNSLAANNPNLADDGLPKAGEIWVNELRLSNFRESGGWGVNARMTAKLADFGMVSVAGVSSTPGFGSIDKKVNERQQENIVQYDISSNFELGKFFPENSGVQIPMYLGFSEGFINPKYNPLDPDVPLVEALNRAETKEERDSIQDISRDYTRRTSLNFTNIQINRTSQRPRFYDLANFSLSYAFHEIYSRNINTEFNIERIHRGALNYFFTGNPTNVQPFRNLKIFQAPVFQLIRDFNFYFLPSYVSFRTDLNRFYNAIQLRNIYNPDFLLYPSFRKDFIWNRFYDIKFDLTRQLKLEFSATNTSRIDEPEGLVDRNLDRDRYEIWKDSVLINLRNFGRTVQYHHTANLTYNLPINKIPLLDWVNLSARYNTSYTWEAGVILPDELGLNLGNTIKNSNALQLNSQFNFLSLYNKIGFLNEINQRARAGERGVETPQQRFRRVSFEKEQVNLKTGVAQLINHRLKTENVTVRVVDANNRPVRIRTSILNENSVEITSDRDFENLKVFVEGSIEIRETVLSKFGESTANFLMMVKDVSISLSQTEGSLLSGYLPGTSLFGQQNVNGLMAPGFPFILGYQNPDFVWEAISKGWLTNDTTLNEPFLMTHNNNLSFRSTIVPFSGFRIDLTASRTYVENTTEFFVSDRYGNFSASGRQVSGNFSMTYFSLGSAFERITSENNYESEVFNNFYNYRLQIAQRLASNRGRSAFYDPSVAGPDGFPDGYGSLSQEVLIPAFFAAYGGKRPDRVFLGNFPLIPLPNWRVIYDGIGRLPILRNLVQSASISHSYRSTYNIGNFLSNFDFTKMADGFSYIRDAVNGNFIPEFDISMISISEQFSPLINLEVIWENDISTHAEIRKSRIVSLSLANNQLSELTSNEWIFGVGYRFRDVQLIFRTGGTQRVLSSDLNIRGDLSIRENKTVVRRLAEGNLQPTAGQTIFSIKFSADYIISERFDVKLFFDRMVNKPIVQLSYPMATTNIGFSLRFTLIQ